MRPSTSFPWTRLTVPTHVAYECVEAYGCEAGPNGNGLSGVIAIDADGDLKAETGYAGDLKGNLYKFTFAMSGNALTVSSQKLLEAGADRPITITPLVARHYTRKGLMVYAGTGSLLSSADAADTTTQHIYGIWDKSGGEYPIQDHPHADGDDACDDFATNDQLEGTLVCQTLTQTTYTGGAESKYARLVTQHEPDWSEHYGWRVALPDTGERLVGRPYLGARLQFMTTNPIPDASKTDYYVESWHMALDIHSGGDGPSPETVNFDLNGDHTLTDDDKIAVEGILRTPVGEYFSDSTFSQPTIVRIDDELNMYYINAVQLPPESSFGQILGGLIDVTTDTPHGGVTTIDFDMLVDDNLQQVCDSYGMTICRGAPAQPVEDPAGGGYGGLPDGHVHAYDKVHQTSYVDYPNLEPRRGLPRIDAYTGDPAVTDGDSPFYQETNEEGNAIIHNTLARLDRLGLAEDDEEPYGSASLTDRLDPNQKFIVVLANADLSTGPAIQIGCRTWNVKDYQDMVQYQLEILGREPDELVDTYHGNASLIFSLNDIRTDSDDGLPDGQCAPETLAQGIEKSTTATLRILFYNRVVQDLAIHATLPQCVWGIHKYDVPFDDPEEGYIDPSINPLGHLTPAQEKQYTGYRWRNGALTMQLLAVNSDDTAAYTLQPAKETLLGLPLITYLPHDKNGNRVGGIIAKAYSWNLIEELLALLFGDDQSGMLYESTVFFDYGDWFNFKTGNASLYCYGAAAAHSRLVQEVVQGMEWGHYTQLTDIFFTDGELNDLYYTYLELLDAVLTATDQAAALQNLADFFAANPDVATYDKLRSWRGHKVWQKEGTGQDWRILPIDRSDYDPSGSSEVQPGYVGGSVVSGITSPGGEDSQIRGWIDLRP